MSYSEMGTMKPSPDTFTVTVRVNGRGEFTREVSNVDSPMGTVQAMIAEELGVEFYEVHPVTYSIVVRKEFAVRVREA